MSFDDSTGLAENDETATYCGWNDPELEAEQMGCWPPCFSTLDLNDSRLVGGNPAYLAPMDEQADDGEMTWGIY